MYILKNAVTSILRNKGRNLLIGIIIIVISCSVSIALAINNSSESLIKSYEEKYEIEATITFNRQNMLENFDPANSQSSKENMNDMFSNANSITSEDIDLYGNSEYVKKYYYTMETRVNSTTIEPAEISSNEFEMSNNKPGRENNFNNETNGDFTLKGYSSIESMTEFIEGNYTIVEGEVSEDFSSNNCLINQELATLNDIEVGDTITIVDSNDDSLTYDLIVTGIYEEKENSENSMNMFSNSVNMIITNTNVLNEIKENNENLMITTTPTFILTSSNIIEDFEEELRDKGLNENLALQTNLEQQENATSTISNVKNFAITFLILTFIIGTIVLLVINMINIRERRYEIGVLRTIGMKKSKVCLQFLSELFIVSFIALILGAGLGMTLSVPVSNSLLEKEISSTQEQNNTIRQNFGKGPNENMMPNIKENFNNITFSGVAQVQAFTSIDAVVDFKVILELLGIGIIITLISGTSAIISIQKFSPLTILKERS